MPAKLCGYPIVGTLAWDGGSDGLVSRIVVALVRVRVLAIRRKQETTDWNRESPCLRRSIMRSSLRRLRLVLAGLCFLVPVLMGQEKPSSKPNDQNDKERRVQKVNLVAERFNFTPSRIKVQQGTL